VRISWKAALDSNGNAVAGYHVYRASSPAGPYSKINTELVTATEFIDTSGVGAASGSGSGSYYAVSSEDADGDESVRSLGVRPAAIVSSAGAAVPACFIGTVAQTLPYKALWILAILTLAVLISKWSKVYGIRLTERSCGALIALWASLYELGASPIRLRPHKTTQQVA
jgi:hypothetical protein